MLTKEMLDWAISENLVYEDEIPTLEDIDKRLIKTAYNTSHGIFNENVPHSARVIEDDGSDIIVSWIGPQFESYHEAKARGAIENIRPFIECTDNTEVDDILNMAIDE